LAIPVNHDMDQHFVCIVSQPLATHFTLTPHLQLSEEMEAMPNLYLFSLCRALTTTLHPSSSSKSALAIILTMIFALSHAEEGIEQQYRKIPGADSKLLSLDIYAPASMANGDVVMFVHGGGWRRGDKAHKFVDNIVPYYRGKGYTLVSTNYRLSPAVRHPTHVQDLAHAIKFVHESMPQAKIWLIGHSSGAHLVSLVATNQRFLAQAGVDPKVLAGVVALDTKYYDIEYNQRFKQFNKLVPQTFGTDIKTWRDASPIRQINKADKQIPPFLVFYTQGNKRKAIADRFTVELRQAGFQAKSVYAAGYGHYDLPRYLGRPGDGMTQLVDRFFTEASVNNFPDQVSP